MAPLVVLGGKIGLAARYHQKAWTAWTLGQKAPKTLLQNELEFRLFGGHPVDKCGRATFWETRPKRVVSVTLWGKSSEGLIAEQIGGSPGFVTGL